MHPISPRLINTSITDLAFDVHAVAGDFRAHFADRRRRSPPTTGDNIRTDALRSTSEYTSNAVATDAVPPPPLPPLLNLASLAVKWHRRRAGAPCTRCPPIAPAQTTRPFVYTAVVRRRRRRRRCRGLDKSFVGACLRQSRRVAA